VQRIEVGLVETVMHRELSIESLNRIEELSLQRVKERLAEVEILQVTRRNWLNGECDG
jgi:hypothetical protein